jgi:hypothetical protein
LSKLHIQGDKKRAEAITILQEEYKNITENDYYSINDWDTRKIHWVDLMEQEYGTLILNYK